MEKVQRFRIDGVLGEGGMGTVYRAYDPELERAVAIKVLRAPSERARALDEHRTVDLREDRPRTHDELLAEARAMAAISHPNVLPVFEVGRVGDQVFLVMELIEGIDLRRWSGTHSAGEIVAVLAAAAEGLAAAHARGIVHGDFKPDNVLIGSDGRVCVADFGVSQFVQGPRASLVRLDDARGTPAYLAPEVWRGEPVTPAADVYAFATTAAEALLGARPDSAEGLAAALDRRGVPARVRDAIVRGLAREPAARPTDLVAALATPIRRRRWVVPAIAGAVAVAATLILATRGEERPRCTVAPDTAWSEARAAELRAKHAAEEAVTAIGARFADVAALRRRACEELDAGTLGTVQHAALVTCLDRLVIDYDERIKATLVAPDRAKSLLGAPPAGEDCRTRRDTAFDPVKQRALVARWLAAIVGPRDRWRPELEEMIVTALAIGDRESAARLGEALGSELAVQGDLPAARKAMELARARAQEAGAAMAELRIVTSHLRFETFHDELAIARLLANDAKVLIQRVPKGTPYVERTLLEIATLARKRGETTEALAYERELLAILEGSKRGDSNAALERRIAIVGLVTQHEGPPPADFPGFVEATQALLEKRTTDKRTHTYMTSTFTLSEAYRLMKDPRGDALWARSLDLLRDQKPEAGASLINHRAMVSGQLFLRDREDEAIEMMREVVRDAGRPESKDVKATTSRGTYLSGLALMLFLTDRAAEAHGYAEDALLELTGKLGPLHPETKKALEVLLSIELEMKDLARADKHLEALARIARASPTAEALADLDVLRARIAHARGDLAAAEPLVRRALATFVELGSKGKLVQGAELQLGRILASRGRAAEALPHLLAGRPADERGLVDCKLDFEIAKVEREAGKRADGDVRAGRCLARVMHIAGFAKRREEIAAWLAAP